VPVAVGSVLGALLIVVIVAVIIIACNSNKRKSRDKVRRASINRGYDPEYEMKNWYGGSRPATAPIVEPPKKDRLGSSLSVGHRSIHPTVSRKMMMRGILIGWVKKTS
jgi:uridine kinase